MPRIQIQMLKGRTAEQKRRLAKGVTEAASEALGISQERISLIMLRWRKTNWHTVVCYGATER